jgi:hypothetical protein
MRPFLFLAPLGMLLLPSCMPAGGSSSTGNGSSNDPGSGLTDSIKSNTVSHAEIAAVDSMGKLPPPRNLLNTSDNTCPVHLRKMKVAEIPIVFEAAGDAANDSTNGLATDEFPFGAAKIISTGNTLLPGEPVTARVYQCPNCMAYRKAADERRNLSAQLVEPK